MSDKQPPSPLRAAILRQRASLTNLLIDPLQRAATRLAKVWHDRELLDLTLMAVLAELPYCKYMYALDPGGIQLSANASREGLVEKDFGRDRSTRPYMLEIRKDKDMTLSEAYLSLRAGRPSLTAMQKIWHGKELLGYLGADFDLRGMPLTKELYDEPDQWRQIKGDPAIRGQLFQQQRIESRLDAQIDPILSVLEELVLENGIFHCKVHFSSSRATIWFIDDPYRYRILEIDDLIDPDICLVYPHRDYPSEASVPADAIRPILDTFRHLRFADDTIYLRSGSINIFNGIVGLNFSCDGSHYIPYDQFLARDSAFWEGI